MRVRYFSLPTYSVDPYWQLLPLQLLRKRRFYSLLFALFVHCPNVLEELHYFDWVPKMIMNLWPSKITHFGDSEATSSSEPLILLQTNDKSFTGTDITY